MRVEDSLSLSVEDTSRDNVSPDVGFEFFLLTVFSWLVETTRGSELGCQLLLLEHLIEVENLILNLLDDSILLARVSHFLVKLCEGFVFFTFPDFLGQEVFKVLIIVVFWFLLLGRILITWLGVVFLLRWLFGLLILGSCLLATFFVAVL